MKSKNVTVTDARLKDALNNVVEEPMQNIVSNGLSDAIDKVMIKTGVITKFYPFLDKAEVQLDINNQKLFCKILHRYGGDIIDFYTPLEDERGFDIKLQEPYIIPRAQQHVCVLNIHDADSEEHLLLGYYSNEDIVGYDPAKPGNIKIISLGEDNNYWVKFGRDGFDYRLPSQPTMSVGDLDDDMQDVDYANSDNVYTKNEVYNKQEVYTKEEVDELIQNLINELTGE